VALVKRQRWKLWLCALAVAAVGACCMWATPVATLFGMNSTILELAASLAGLIVLVGGCLAVRCPACGLSLVWHGISTQPANDWLAWLLDVQFRGLLALLRRDQGPAPVRLAEASQSPLTQAGQERTLVAVGFQDHQALQRVRVSSLRADYPASIS
jgi:hypothetical protein